MLSGDIRELYKKVVAECKKIDEEETKLVDPEHLKVILEEVIFTCNNSKLNI